MAATFSVFVTDQIIVAGNERKVVQRISGIDRQQRAESICIRRKCDNAIGRSRPGSPHCLPAGNAVNKRFARFDRRVGKRTGNPIIRSENDRAIGEIVSEPKRKDPLSKC